MLITLQRPNTQHPTQKMRHYHPAMQHTLLKTIHQRVAALNSSPHKPRTSPRVTLFPNWLGQKRRGAEQFQMNIVGINNVHPNRQHPVWCDDNLFGNLHHLYDTNLGIFKQYQQQLAITETLCDHGASPPFQPGRELAIINVGGDHSMSIATVAATLRVHPEAKVLWVDAHPDLNTYASSVSKNYHGMPLAYLSGLDEHRSLPFLSDVNRLNLSDRLMYVGIRDIDAFEAEMIAKQRIPFVTINDIRTDPARSLTRVLEWVGDSPLHVSFDVDVIDPSEVPSTGTPVPDGLLTSEAKLIMNSLLFGARVVNVDLCELNTATDRGGELGEAMSLANVSKVFANYFNPPICGR